MGFGCEDKATRVRRIAKVLCCVGKVRDVEMKVIREQLR
jgi:hypothetical protein